MAALLADLDTETRIATLAALDEISRPMGVRELDLAMAREGIPRSQRRPLARALLSRFDVIVLEPK